MATSQDISVFRTTVRQIADILSARYSDKQDKPAALAYALAYINEVPYLLDSELHVQGLYIQSNLGWWRGDIARRYKSLLKGATTAVR